MKTTKLTSEQLETMSYADVANLILTEAGHMMNIQDLFMKVIRLMELPESYFESKIADFFGLLSTDKRFIMLEKGNWDLRVNHSNKIKIDTDEEDEDEEIILDEEEIDIDSENEDDEINYDDESSVDDDDEEDDLKDLVIMDEGDEESMM